MYYCHQTFKGKLHRLAKLYDFVQDKQIALNYVERLCQGKYMQYLLLWMWKNGMARWICSGSYREMIL